MKIFCIGFNKTGSTSLYRAIKDLGFRADEQTFEEGEFLMYNIRQGDFNSVFKWMEKRSDIELFKDVPFSLPNVWERLYEKYPDAKYILSERDTSKQWYNSIKKFHIRIFKLLPFPTWEDISNVNYRYTRMHPWLNIPRNGKGGFLYDFIKCLNSSSENPYDEKNLIRSYELHNIKVKKFFKDKDNFISINVSNDKDYLKLCNFLEKKPIRNKFPRLKVTRDNRTW